MEDMEAFIANPSLFAFGIWQYRYFKYLAQGEHVTISKPLPVSGHVLVANSFSVAEQKEV